MVLLSPFHCLISRQRAWSSSSGTRTPNSEQLSHCCCDPRCIKLLEKLWIIGERREEGVFYSKVEIQHLMSKVWRSCEIILLRTEAVWLYPVAGGGREGKGLCAITFECVFGREGRSLLLHLASPGELRSRHPPPLTSSHSRAPLALLPCLALPRWPSREVEREREEGADRNISGYEPAAVCFSSPLERCAASGFSVHAAGAAYQGKHQGQKNTLSKTHRMSLVIILRVLRPQNTPSWRSLPPDELCVIPPQTSC